MKRFISGVMVFIMSTPTFAAFYMQLEGVGRITVSNDIQNAVLVYKNFNSESYQLINQQGNQIDAMGRPYAYASYLNVKCKGNYKTCPYDSLDMIFYSDKLHDAYVANWNVDKGTQNWNVHIPFEQMTRD